jgi:hypothetical protein
VEGGMRVLTCVTADLDIIILMLFDTTVKLFCPSTKLFLIAETMGVRMLFRAKDALLVVVVVLVEVVVLIA